MDRLNQHSFKDFLSTAKETEPEELARMMWPDHDTDPRTTPAPVAERVFNKNATQWAWMKEISEYADDYQWLMERLRDEKSRRTLVSIFNYRISWNKSDLTEVKQTPKYFEWDILDKPTEPVYVDGGAYTGGSIDNFLKTYGDGYTSIYAFEPFPESVAVLREKYSKIRDVHIIPKGLWDSESTVNISGQDQGATLLSDGTVCHEHEAESTQIYTTTLDSTLNELPDFIKMDMEGSEIRALRGAERCIRSGMPALAICAYHLIDDLRTIPRVLSDTSGDNYEFILRNYKAGGSAEIVLYGNPIK